MNLPPVYHLRLEDWERFDVLDAQLGRAAAIQQLEESINILYPVPPEASLKRKKKSKSQRARAAASREASTSPIPPQSARLESRPSSAASTRSYAEVVQQQVSDARSRSSSILPVRSAEAEPTSEDDFRQVGRHSCAERIGHRIYTKETAAGPLRSSGDGGRRIGDALHHVVAG
ncbi:hypothetical protein ILUMI_15030 [Ignelater luminosus]|uniref:Uncharacterized protein n=1 Tax=Ignelater luminosus TaxID=2038154 RepID=A0A8K0CPC9_IGNLU|nr:hypothetical protein ILUMI_15030 [Ignelater luminosus]